MWISIMAAAIALSLFLSIGATLALQPARHD